MTGLSIQETGCKLASQSSSNVSETKYANNMMDKVKLKSVTGFN